MKKKMKVMPFKDKLKKKVSAPEEAAAEKAEEDEEPEKVELDFATIEDEREAEIGKIEARNKAVEEEKGKIQSMLQTERERGDSLDRKIEALEKDIKERDARVQALEREMAIDVQDLQGKIQQRETLEHEFTRKLDAAASTIMEKSAAIAERDADIASLKTETISLQDRIHQLESERDTLMTSAKADKERLEQQIKSLKEQKDTMANKVIELEDKIQKPVRAKILEDLETVRTCISCKQFVLVREDYKHVKAVQSFDAAHRGHMLATLTYAEVKQNFSSKTEEFLENQ